MGFVKDALHCDVRIALLQINPVSIVITATKVVQICLLYWLAFSSQRRHKFWGRGKLLGPGVFYTALTSNKSWFAALSENRTLWVQRLTFFRNKSFIFFITASRIHTHSAKSHKNTTITMFAKVYIVCVYPNMTHSPT